MKHVHVIRLLWIVAYSQALGPVAVIGSTGRLGRNIVQTLSNQGYQVRCLLRHRIDDNASSPPKSLGQAESPSDVAQFLRTLPGVTMVSGDINDGDTLCTLVDGCDACIAAHGPGAPKPFWRALIFPSLLYPDTDPSHPKQLNYVGMEKLMEAMKASGTCRRLVRITGKGESPWSIFSILINALGGLAKAWNYEGEQLLRKHGASNNIEYTIIRPGVMKESVVEETSKGLKDDGQDMKVSPVSYRQIAELAVATLGYPNCAGATLTAMNTPDGSPSYDPLLAKVCSDRRAFPDSLMDEHRKATRVGGLAITAVLLFALQLAIRTVLAIIAQLL